MLVVHIKDCTGLATTSSAIPSPRGDSDRSTTISPAAQATSTAAAAHAKTRRAKLARLACTNTSARRRSEAV